MSMSPTEQLHNLGIQLYHAVGAGAIHVPYQKPLHERMSHPKVGDTVTHKGRTTLTRVFGSGLTGTLLHVDNSDTTVPAQALIAPLDMPEREIRAPHAALIALPVTTSIAGPNNDWATNPDPIPAHLLRCADDDAAEQVLAQLDRTGYTAEPYGRNLLFWAANFAIVRDIADMAAECHWATEGEAQAMLARIPGDGDA